MDGDATNGGGDLGGIDSRRSILKKAGLVAGAAWVVPTVLSLDVPAASASGTPGAKFEANTGGNTATTLTVTGVPGAGVLLAAITIRDAAPTITPPSGWSLLGRSTTGDTTVAFYAVYESSATPANYTFTFTGARAALGVARYVGASAWEAFLRQTNTPASTSLTAPSISISNGSSNVVFLGGYGVGGTVGTIGSPYVNVGTSVTTAGPNGAGVLMADRPIGTILTPPLVIASAVGTIPSAVSVGALINVY